MNDETSNCMELGHVISSFSKRPASELSIGNYAPKKQIGQIDPLSVAIVRQNLTAFDMPQFHSGASVAIGMDIRGVVFVEVNPFY
jgi:hypothetical protein